MAARRFKSAEGGAVFFLDIAINRMRGSPRRLALFAALPLSILNNGSVPPCTKHLLVTRVAPLVIHAIYEHRKQQQEAHAYHKYYYCDTYYTYDATVVLQYFARG